VFVEPGSFRPADGYREFVFYSLLLAAGVSGSVFSPEMAGIVVVSRVEAVPPKCVGKLL